MIKQEVEPEGARDADQCICLQKYDWKLERRHLPLVCSLLLSDDLLRFQAGFHR